MPSAQIQKLKSYFAGWWEGQASNRQKRREEKAARTFNGKKDGILVWSDYRHPKARLAYSFDIFFLLLFTFFALAPILWLFITSFKSTNELHAVPYHFWPNEFNLGKIVDVWNESSIERNFLNSAIVVLGSAVSAILFNGILAYAVSILKPKGYQIVYALVMLSFMIPSAANMVPLFKEISDFGLIDNFLPLCLAAGANAYYFVLFKTYFDSLPKELFEAARIDGAGDIRVFFSIVAPLSRPIMGVVAIFASTAAWSDFLLPSLVLQNDAMKTVMVRIYSFQSTISTMPNFGPDKLLMLLVISIVPLVFFFAIFQRQITSTSTTSGIKE